MSNMQEPGKIRYTSGMAIVCNLRALMDARGLTLLQLEEAAGVDYSVLSEMRANKRKRYDASVLSRLCAYFQCKTGDLLVYIPDPALPPSEPPTS